MKNRLTALDEHGAFLAEQPIAPVNATRLASLRVKVTGGGLLGGNMKRTIGAILAAALSAAALAAPASAVTTVPSTNTLTSVNPFSTTSGTVTGTYVPGTAGDNAQATCDGASRTVSVRAVRTSNGDVFAGSSGSTATSSPFNYSFPSTWASSLPSNKTYNVTTTVAGSMSGEYAASYVCTDATSNTIAKNT